MIKKYYLYNINKFSDSEKTAEEKVENKLEKPILNSTEIVESQPVDADQEAETEKPIIIRERSKF